MKSTPSWAYNFILLLMTCLFFSCNGSESEQTPGIQFTSLPATQSGLDFQNTLTETEELNYFVHSGFYNGAGMAVGDLNNDGLVELFFCGNQVPNSLYQNKGELTFENISQQSGIGQANGWCTGATMVDINADGFLDLYLCRYFSPDEKTPATNLLYINNGDLTFTESAAKYGLADAGNSVQATFFDYDLDGDLDVYVVNQPTNFRSEKGDIVAPNEWKDTDRLYRNEGNNQFQDVTQTTGILNFAYGLSAVVGDLNQDGYPDIFVSNDYEWPDHMYLNNQHGGFNRIEDFLFKHISNYSMGADIADFNNDGWLDIFVADMLAEHHYREKANMGAMNTEKFNDMVAKGMHHQYMRNMLHLNNKRGSFSEIGQLAGVSRTDWSWAALFADFDNDGWKDLFVTNGILRDVRNNDAQKTAVDNTLTHTQSFPSQPLANVMFHNTGDLRFDRTSEQWGLTDQGFSNGAVYADLDNDGDLDLVTNNVNAPAGLYRNNQATTASWLQIELKGPAQNPRGRGAKVTVYREQDQLFQEQTLERGYMSGLSGILHFGLGDATQIEKIEVVWPGGKQQTLLPPELNQRLVVRAADAKEQAPNPPRPNPLFIPRQEPLGLNWTHRENPFDDFEKQVLLPHKLSTFGPGMAVGDVNGDGADDCFVGGAAGQPGVLFLKQPNGTFSPASTATFAANQSAEDMGALFVDTDGDGDLDLYVVSGGNSVPENAQQLQDRLYLNDGKGNFKRTSNHLPNLRSSGSCVIAADYDADGDPDLFVGGRIRPGNYPLGPNSYLLENENGVFKDATAEKAPALTGLGMVSGGLWTDYDQDGQIDLILVGEWMPITLFKNTNGTLTRDDNHPELAQQTGWWNSIVGGDFDKDGDIDYVVGNQGLNTKFEVSTDTPLELYSLDFDSSNGRDLVLVVSDSGQAVPVRGRECSSQQIPGIAEQFEDYHTFASASLTDIYAPEKLEQAIHLQAHTFASVYLQNNQEAGFEVTPLPVQAQFAPVFGMVVNDFNLDGNLDLLLTGNFYAPEVETGRQDAGIGVLLHGDGAGGFKVQGAKETGFFTAKDARSLALLYVDGFPVVLVGNNNDALEAFFYVNATGAGESFLANEWNAEVYFKDGSSQRIEPYLGSGYLSASNNLIQIGPQTEKIIFYQADGTQRVIE